MLAKEKFPSKVKDDVTLSPYTTYKIGGPAKHFIEVESKEELREALKWLHETQERFMILGKGSNLLFSEEGFDGTVILNKIQKIEWSEGSVRVGGGYSFALLGTQTARKGLSGLEFASGIPGTVGGAVFMNAGANGQEVKDSLLNVEYIDEKGDEHILNRDDLAFSYRHSPFHDMKGAIAAATFALSVDRQAKDKQKKILDYRLSTQPYKDKTCGCCFRNPTGDSAGRLIEACGLKGHSIGDAMVSNLHANFLVNRGNATADDMKKLAAYIKSEVERKTGVVLKEEVRYIPYQESGHG